MSTPLHVSGPHAGVLEPYAVPLQGQLGREFPEEHDTERLPFQRDRDRIIHTQAFRRLQGKTQVFVAGEGDHFRTRLTHTMEVAQISRDIARGLGLNEDLTECIALAHDLGHPPFGHAGEAALNTWARSHRLLFEHNRQSIRIVTILAEQSSTFHGLNVNREVIEGLHKHEGGVQDRSLSLEAQVVDFSDAIAYSGHDLDDGIRAGLFGLQDAAETKLGSAAWERAKAHGTLLRGSIVHLLVTDLYSETRRRLQGASIKHLDDVYAAKSPLVGFSVSMEKDLEEIRIFLQQRMYNHERVVTGNLRGQGIVAELCAHYEKNPTEKIRSLQNDFGISTNEAILDYVSGMTDAFATEQWPHL